MNTEDSAPWYDYATPVTRGVAFHPDRVTRDQIVAAIEKIGAAEGVASVFESHGYLLITFEPEWFDDYPMKDAIIAAFPAEALQAAGNP